MKKKRLKDLMKFAMLLFGISLITTNCNKDDLSLQTKTLETTTGYKSIKISSKEIKTNRSISKILEKLKENESDNNTFNKEVYDSINDFTIETDEAIYITNEGYHSYTFSITRTIDNGLTENLLLSLQADQSYKAYIVEYTLTAVEKEQLLNGNSIVDLQNKVTYTLLNDFDSAAIFSKDPRCYEYLVHASPWGPTIVEEVEIECPHEEIDNTIDAGASAEGGGNNSTPDDSSPVGDDNTGNNTTTGTTTQTGSDPGGDSSSSGGDASNPDSEANGDNTTAPTDENCIVDANGNCIGNATTPKIKNTKTVDEKNCIELKKLGNNTPTRQSYQDLQSKVNLDREFGYSFAINALPEEQELANGNAINLNMPHGGLIYGGSHTHPFESHPDHKIFPMFSIADLGKLGLLAIKHSNPGVPKNYNLFVLTMTVKNGPGSETFAIKIDDFIQFVSSFITPYYNKSIRDRKRFGRVLNDDYDEAFITGGAGNVAENYLKVMFKFMDNESINGMSVFKATNTNLTNWEKLTYNTEDNTIERANCN